METATGPAVVSLPKGLSPEEERLVLLMRADTLSQTPTVTQQLKPPRQATSPIWTPRPTPEEVHAWDQEELAPPEAGPQSQNQESVAGTMSIPDLDDLQGDASVWRQTWTAEPFRFRIPSRFQDTRRAIVKALGLPTDESSAPAQYVRVPFDPLTVTIANHDAREMMSGTGTSLGESVFARKFPAGVKEEKEFLTPQVIDEDAIRYIKSRINPDFDPKKPFGSSSSSHLADAHRFGQRLDERMGTISRLTSFLFQTQAFISHAISEQRELQASVQDHPEHLSPMPSGGFSTEVLADAMELASFLSAALNRISLHMLAEVRLENCTRLLQHVVPAPGCSGFTSSNKRDLLKLPLFSDRIFAGKFTETRTTETQGIAFQKQHLGQGFLPAHLSGAGKGSRIPKKTQGSKPKAHGLAQPSTFSDQSTRHHYPTPGGYGPKKEESLARRGGRSDGASQK